MSGLADEVAAQEADAIVAATAGEVAVVVAEAAVVLAETQSAIVVAEAAAVISDVKTDVENIEDEQSWLKNQVTNLQSAMEIQSSSMARLTENVEMLIAAQLASQVSQSLPSPAQGPESIVAAIPLAEVVVAQAEAPNAPLEKESRRHRLL